jgi:hypothetical protein
MTGNLILYTRCSITHLFFFLDTFVSKLKLNTVNLKLLSVYNLKNVINDNFPLPLLQKDNCFWWKVGRGGVKK